MTSPLRTIGQAALAFCMLTTAAVGAESAADYPSKPIKIVLPYAGGGAADNLARAVASSLHQQFGQPVIVESRPGANSMIGAEYVARAPADGYTLLYVGWPTISTNVVMYKNVNYKQSDFAPITTLFRSPIGLTVRQDFPASNLTELIDYARKQGSLSYGTSGIGSSPHLLLEKLSKAIDVPFVHVPYKGEGPPVLDVLGGHLPLFAGGLTTPAQHVQAGTLKILATSNAERLPGYPDVPTFKEVGFGEHVFTFWHGMAAPAGVPAAIIDKLYKAIEVAMASPEVGQLLTPDQFPATMPPDEFKALIQQDIDTWSPVIAAGNFTE